MSSATVSFGQLVDAHYWGRETSEQSKSLELVAHADQLLIRNDVDKALDIYEKIANPDAEVQTKIGYALHLLGRSMDALKRLDEVVCTQSSAGCAVLASAHSSVAFRAPGNHYQQAQKFAQLAVSWEHPSAYALQVYLQAGNPWEDKLRTLELVNRGLALYKQLYLLAWRARMLKATGKSDDVNFDELTEAASKSPACASALLELALDSNQCEFSLRAIEHLTQSLDNDSRIVAADDEAILRLMAHLRLTDTPNRVAILRQAYNNFLKDYPEGHLTLRNGGLLALDRRQLIAALQLQTTAILGEHELVERHANTLAELALAAPEDPENVFVYLRLGAYAGYHQGLAQLDLRRVEGLVSGAPMWSALRLAMRLEKSRRECDHDNWAPEVDAVNSLAEALNTLPIDTWVAELLHEALLKQSKPNPTLLAQVILRSARVGGDFYEFPQKKVERLGKKATGEFATALLSELDLLRDTESINLTPTWLLADLHKKGHGDCAVQLARKVDQRAPSGKHKFALGYALYNASQYLEAAELFRQLSEANPSDYASTRNLALSQMKAEDLAGLDETLQIITSKSLDERSDWPALARDINEWISQLRQQVVEKNRFNLAAQKIEHINQKLEFQALTINDLSLPQITALLALLRTDFDHATSSAGPIDQGDVSFDPTGKFVNLLESLTAQGVIGINNILKTGVLVSGEQIIFDWSKVTFRIPPTSMDFQRQIRALSPEQWPRHWIQELETFAVSVAVEECLAYIWHLADERKLSLPDSAELREVYRSHLQRASVGQCWYYTYRTIQSTSDYQVRYRAGQKHVASHMLRKLREIGEVAQEKGWDTSYGRIRALPRSHVASALHDVLTGWGEDAFKGRIRDLIL